MSSWAQRYYCMSEQSHILLDYYYLQEIFNEAISVRNRTTGGAGCCLNDATVVAANDAPSNTQSPVGPLRQSGGTRGGQ